MKKAQFFVINFIFLLITAAASAQVTFRDVTVEAGLHSPSGITFSTWGDYDNDGDADLLFLHAGGKELYRNEGDGTFLNVTQISGMTDISNGSSTGMFMDFDNDGDLDLFMGGAYGQLGDLLYENNGDGTFTDVSQSAGMKSEVRQYFGSISFDYDNDGLLDIYVTNWADKPYPNFLYHNEGNGRFEDIAEQTELYRIDYSDGIAPGDYDNDGDLDLFITRAIQTTYNVPDLGNVLYRNEGDGSLTDVTQQAGLSRQGFDVDTFFWDYDNDGDLDLFVTCWAKYIADETNVLYRNNGNGTFTDVTASAGIKVPSVQLPSVGAYYGDYDNDGWLDLCVTHRDLPNALYHNNRDGTFTDVSRETGIAGTNTGSLSFVDYDSDGDLDILVARYFGNRVALYRNNGTSNHWLQLSLVGAQSNRDAIGARVKVTAGGLSMLREMTGCSGAGTKQDRLPLHFGLGSNLQADVIEIRWPSGITQTFRNISADQRLTVHEIEGPIVVVYSAFPDFGYPDGGTSVQIKGGHFHPGSRVFFGGVEAIEARVESLSLITAVTPPGAKGTVDVEVVLPDGESDILRDGFQYGTLKVIRITPETGPVSGGSMIRIEGVGFQSGAQVQIGGKNLIDAFVAPMLIRGTLPPGDAGVMDVSVANPDGETDMLPLVFTYLPPPTIGRISPVYAPLMSYTEVEIAIGGTGFVPTPDVHIGGVAVRSVDFVSSDRLTVRTPYMPEIGIQDVTVVNPDGQRAVLPDAVTILAPIEIKRVEPTSGGLEGGGRITVFGEPTVEVQGRTFPSRFAEARLSSRIKMFIGDTEAGSVILESDNVITAMIPPNTPGPKDVRVINVDGQWDTLENAFTYNVLPQIARVTPNNGRLAGGTEINIQGSNFLPGARVLFSTETGTFMNASSVGVVSSAIINALTPAGKPGAKDVVIRNPDMQEAILPEGFTYNPLPTITSITPNNGLSSGRTKVIIEGTGFLLGASVMIGERSGTTMVRDDMTIEAVTPPNPPGLWDVRVVNPDTQEAVMREGFVSVGELAYNFPNPFQASRGTTFRYVTDKPVQYINVKVFNLAGIPIDVVQQSGSNEVEWHNPLVHGGLYIYLMEVRLEDGSLRQFKNVLEVYE